MRSGAVRLMLLAALAAAQAMAATKITVSVVEQKTGKFVTGLQASDFIVTDDKTPKQVEAVEAGTSPLDVLLLLDTSLVGGAVQPIAANLVAQIRRERRHGDRVGAFIG